MTKLQQIREIIIKINAEIVELKFGCVVVFNDSSQEVIIGISLEDTEVERVQTRTHYQIGVSNISEIIGRPIRLADVLLAIPSEKSSVRNEKYECDACGFIGGKEFFEDNSNIYNGFDMEHIGCKDCGFPINIKTRFLSSDIEKITKAWNLKDDNLDNQSKECISFIHKILT